MCSARATHNDNSPETLMRHHKTLGSLALLTAMLPALAQPLPTATPEGAGMSSQRLQNIDAFFASEIAQKRVPGAVVAIARNGKLVYFKAFGQADPIKGTAMATDTIFQLASMTKIQAAVGALALTEQGRLPLQSKLSDYFPAFGTMQVGVPSDVKPPDGKFTTQPLKRPILIHDLFRHTSGMTYGGRPDGSSPIAALWPSGGAAQVMGTSAQMTDNLAKLPLVYQPGTVFEYSLAFDVLGAVVEKITNKTLGEHLSDTVWKPLKMTDSTFRPNESQMARVARPFANNPLDGKPQAIAALQRPATFDCGGACAFGSMGDYIRFGQMLLNGGNLDGAQVLSPAFVRLMTSDHLGAGIQNNVANVEPHRGGYGFGLGVAVRVHAGQAAVPGSAGEFSWNGANGTGFFADPKEQLVVAYGTAAPGELRKFYREQVQDLVYGALTR
jgi:CubicO group peptidase (beta-lactamase class C family)